MSNVTKTSLNSDAVQKLYEQSLSRGGGNTSNESRQRGSGFVGGLISNIAGNVFKAIDAGQRLAKRKRKRKQRVNPKKRRAVATAKMVGSGRKKLKRRKAPTKPRGRKTKTCIKTRRAKQRFTKGQSGGGSRRVRRRTVVTI